MTSGFHLDGGEFDRAGLFEASRVAGRAFSDDPFFTFLLPAASWRPVALARFFHSTLGHLGIGGRLVCVRDEHDAITAVSAWLPAGSYPQPIGTQLAQVPGTLRAMARRPKALVDGNRYLVAAAKVHPKEHHWYLWLLVVDPVAQRRGLGTMLLEPTLLEVDAEGAGVYLETQKEDNLAYYRRFGFELRDTLRPVTDGPALYSMWRAPR